MAALNLTPACPSCGHTAHTTIRAIAICIFRNGERILVSEGYDDVARTAFARPLGGAIEVGETSAQAVAREIREELNQPVRNLRLLGVLENIFTYAGHPGHEVVFVYDGEFADAALYDEPELQMAEVGRAAAKWRRLESFGEQCRLVPEGLLAMIDGFEPMTRQSARSSE